MDFALDLILVIVLIVSIFIGYKKGFVKSLTDLVSNLVSAVVAKIVSVALAPVVYANHFESALRDKIDMKFTQTGADAAEKITNALEEIPNISNLLSVLGIDKEQAVGAVTTEVQNGGADVVEALMTNIVTPVATFVFRIIIFLIAFAVCMLLMKLISRLLNKAAKLPVLKQANALFGLLFGAVKGLIIIAVICALCQLIVGLFYSEGLATLISNSTIVSVFNTFFGAVKI